MSLFTQHKYSALVLVVVTILFFGMFSTFSFLNPVSLFALTYSSSVAGEKRTMCNPKTYTAVGETLALYCQSYQVLRSTDFGTVYSDSVALYGVWTPKGLRGHGTIRQNGASIEMGGPLHSHGYELSLDTNASTAVTNVWQLYYTEGKRDSMTKRHLSTIHMGSARQFSEDDLLSMKQQVSIIPSVEK